MLVVVLGLNYPLARGCTGQEGRFDHFTAFVRFLYFSGFFCMDSVTPGVENPTDSTVSDALSQVKSMAWAEAIACAYTAILA